jgi:ubiquinone/menaquinone biosynthesis C-methylase UbiE
MTSPQTNSPRTHEEYFDRLAAGWDERMPPTLPQAVIDLVQSLGLATGEAVLDLGSGSGIALEPLRRSIGPRGRLVALDVSAQMLAQARQRRRPAEALFVQADGANLPFAAGAFDAILCNATFPHFPDKLGALREMARALRPGGKVWISHLAGREHTNAIHQRSGGVIAEDRVPEGDDIRRLLETAGFANIEVIDRPNRYLAVAQRPKGKGEG